MSPRDDAHRSTAVLRRPSGLHRLAGLGPVVRPASATSIGVVESVVVLLATTAIAFFRLGGSSLRGVIWAEDGQVFLQQAHASGLWGNLLRPYAGYALLVPRLLAQVVSWAPLISQGLLLVLSSAVLHGLVALLTYHVVRAHSPRGAAAVLAALVVAAVPVGPETIDNLANTQWFLLVGATFAVLWAPKTRWGRAVSMVALAGCAVSCPFGIVPVALAAVVWLMVRTRAARDLFAVGALAVAVQILVMLTAPPRVSLAPVTLTGVGLARGYVRRVVGDGFLGSATFSRQAVVRDLGTGLLVLAALVLLSLLAARSRPRTLLVPGLLVATSIVLYAGPVVISKAVLTLPYASGRYFVAPVALLLIATVMVAESALTVPMAAPVLAWRVVSAALVACCLVAMASSWLTPDSDPRLAGRGWASVVADGRRACRADRTPFERLDISPPGWFTVLSCQDLVGDAGASSTRGVARRDGG